jgi:predicted secreted protein
LSITGSLIIYVLIWWIVFFALLPIDVNREKRDNIKGIDPGAPENPKIIKKFAYSTLITYIIIKIIEVIKVE